MARLIHWWMPTAVVVCTSPPVHPGATATLKMHKWKKAVWHCCRSREFKTATGEGMAQRGGDVSGIRNLNNFLLKTMALFFTFFVGQWQKKLYCAYGNLQLGFGKTGQSPSLAQSEAVPGTHHGHSAWGAGWHPGTRWRLPGHPPSYETIRLPHAATGIWSAGVSWPPVPLLFAQCWGVGPPTQIAAGRPSNMAHHSGRSAGKCADWRGDAIPFHKSQKVTVVAGLSQRSVVAVWLGLQVAWNCGGLISWPEKNMATPHLFICCGRWTMLLKCKFLVLIHWRTAGQKKTLFRGDHSADFFAKNKNEFLSIFFHIFEQWMQHGDHYAQCWVRCSLVSIVVVFCHARAFPIFLQVLTMPLLSCC